MRISDWSSDVCSSDLPLAFHVVTALEGVPFRKRVAIVSGTRLDFAARGYEMIENKAPINGLSGSIKLGVEACRACDADAVLIALADMPRVTADRKSTRLNSSH